MAEDMVAHASIEIDAPAIEIWQALVDPDLIKTYMFGATVTTDWRTGSPITWTGEWNGRSFEDKGFILRVEPGRLLEYSHYSPLSGLPDSQEHYHVVTVELTPIAPGTRVDLTQRNIASHEVLAHSEANWQLMLGGLKKVVEGR